MRSARRRVSIAIALWAVVSSAAWAQGTWHWDYPLPQGNALYDVWGSSATDLFAVGDAGTIVHFNGTAWTVVTSGTTKALWGVWGTSASNILVVGSGGTILRYNGSTWAGMASGTAWDLNAVWGSSATDVFAVGDGGTIRHYDGSSWGNMASATNKNLHGVWGSSGSNVFAVGEGGVIVHYDGFSWSAMASNTTQWLLGVWGSSGSDVFAVGFGGTILRLNAGFWSAMASGTTNVITDVWGTSSSNVYALTTYGDVLFYNGNPWVEVAHHVVTEFRRLWGNSASSIFAVGEGGAIARYDGSSWKQVAGSTVFWASSVWGSGAADVFAVGSYGAISHYDGKTWNPMTSGTGMSFGDVWGSSTTNVFAVGQLGTIRRFNGSSWGGMTSPSSSNLNGVWGSSGTNVFAVGDDGTILRYDGNSWGKMTSNTTQDLLGVWGSSATNVFAVGAGGIILRYNGNSWQGMTSNTTQNLYSVWGSSGTDVFAVGYAGTIRHFNGSTWDAMTSGTGWHFSRVWGSSGSDVFAVGALGTIRHFNGSSWSEVSAGTGNYLSGVWGTSGSNVFAVGEDGAILHLTPQLALNQDRFRVEVAWATPNGATGVGTPVELTSDSGYFWFFGSSNVELLVKILDGRAVNGKFWVFYGALTDVAYGIRITDLVTSAVKTYWGQQGMQQSGHDVNAFSDSGASSASASEESPEVVAALSDFKALLRKMGGLLQETESQEEGPPLASLGSLPQDTSLVGYWRFDNAGSLGLDSSGYGNNGIVTTPDVSFVEYGRIGGGAKFIEAATDRAIRVPYNSSLSSLTDFTIATWVKVWQDNVDDGNAVLVQTLDTGPYGLVEPFGFYATHKSVGGRAALRIVNQLLSLNATVPFNGWHHVAVTFISSTRSAAFYLDGNPAGTATFSTGLVPNQGLIYIGTSPAGNAEEFCGLMDEVRLYNRVLSRAQIDAIVLADTPGLSLLNNRFVVRVGWSAGGESGRGVGVSLTSECGYFWFFDRSNLELLFKMLDGRGVNGKFWAFYGSLTDVAFTITVTDTVTGAVKTYQGQQGVQQSGNDTNAF